MLNKSKGPAVHSLRAQADKAEYSMEMRKTLQNTDHLTIRQGEVSEIVTDEDNNIVGAKLLRELYIIVRRLCCAPVHI